MTESNSFSVQLAVQQTNSTNIMGNRYWLPLNVLLEMVRVNCRCIDLHGKCVSFNSESEMEVESNVQPSE